MSHADIPESVNAACLASQACLRRRILVVIAVSAALAPRSAAIAEDVVIKTPFTSCVRFSPDGKTLATCGFGSDTITLWDVETTKAVGELTVPGMLGRHKISVFTCDWSPDGKLIAAGCKDQTIRIFVVAERKEMAVLRGHKDCVRSVHFSPDGGRLLSGDDNGLAKVWDVETQADVLTFEKFKGRVIARFSPDGETAVIGSAERMQLWSFEQRKWLSAADSLAGTHDMHFARGGARIFTVGNDQVLRAWRTADLEASVVVHTKIGNLGLAVSTDGSLVATQPKYAVIGVYDGETGKEIMQLAMHSSGVRALDFSPDDRLLASAERDGGVILWDLASRMK